MSKKAILTIVRQYIGYTILTILMFYTLWLVLVPSFRTWFLAGNYKPFDYVKDFIICMAFTFLIHLFNQIIHQFFRHRQNSYTLIFIHSTVLLVSSLLVAVLSSILAEWLWYGVFDVVAIDMLVFTLISITLNAQFFTTRFWDSYRREQQRRHQLEVRMLQLADQEKQSQLLVLKKQLDPHFLFNNLSVLSSLIEDDPERALEFLNALSKMYRYLTINSLDQMTNISEELKILNWYQYLLSVRFRDGLVVHISDEVRNCKGMIPSMGLFTLVANSFKHTQRKPSVPVIVEVYKEDDCIVVENELRPLEIPIKSTGVGLNNLSERCRLLQNRKLEILQTDNKFIAKLPISK